MIIPDEEVRRYDILSFGKRNNKDRLLECMMLRKAINLRRESNRIMIKAQCDYDREMFNIMIDPF